MPAIKPWGSSQYSAATASAISASSSSRRWDAVGPSPLLQGGQTLTWCAARRKGRGGSRCSVSDRGGATVCTKQELGWSGRGDSNPRLQLGKLSYYPYTTAAHSFSYSTPLHARQGPRRPAKWECTSARVPDRFPDKERKRGSLIDLRHARRLDHRRLLLPLGKVGRLDAVGVNAAKLFTVVIVDGNQPVPVLAALVFSQFGSFSSS